MNIKDVKININVKNGITVSKDTSNINFFPGEVEKIVKLLVYANSLEGIKRLPPFITDTPYRVVFTDESLLLFKQGMSAGEGFKFKFKDISNLIEIFKSTIPMYTNAAKYSTLGKTIPQIKDDVVHGKD